MVKPVVPTMQPLLRDRTVLVIDDDVDVVFSTTLMLEDAGYRVLSGYSAAEALTMTRSQRPSLVLLDVELPDGDGVEVARQIKSDPDLEGVFLVLASGKRTRPQEQADGLNLGLADGYLTRPLTKVDFLARIESFFRMRSYQEQLRQKNAELEWFTYTVSHDLKSPLITIKGFSKFLEEKLAGQEDEDVRSSLAFICSAADKMKNLLDDLLHFSRLGKVTESTEMTETVALGALVEDVVASLHGQLRERGVTFKLQGTLPMVKGSPTHLRELFQNLIENSVKYMGDQSAPLVEVGAALSDSGPCCYVRDNGQGIAPEFHDKVFGLFQRLDNDDRGTGVGLALVKRIVELHGGQVWIDSAGEGSGTTVWFTLPWLDAPPAG